MIRQAILMSQQEEEQRIQRTKTQEAEAIKQAELASQQDVKVEQPQLLQAKVQETMIENRVQHIQKIEQEQKQVKEKIDANEGLSKIEMTAAQIK